MNQNYIDTHAHLNLAAFVDDALAVAKRCGDEGVAVINVGTNFESSKRAVELAGEVEVGNCFAIAGLHPIKTVTTDPDDPRGEMEVFDKDRYRELAKSEHVVGIGECGFDYFHTTPDSYEIQERAFIEQIELANELDLPIMIHTRGPKPGEGSPTGRSVYADVYDVLKQYAKVPFNVHFFAGTYGDAVRFIDLGGTISFTGVITFPKTENYAEVIKNVPLEKLHGETDSPYVAPVPHRGKRAEPWMVKEVYKKIAEIRGEGEEIVRNQLLRNSCQFYDIDL